MPMLFPSTNVQAPPVPKGAESYFKGKIEGCEQLINSRTANLRRLEAQRNALNTKVKLLRQELHLLQEPASYVGEVVKLMGKTKVLVKVHQGKAVIALALLKVKRTDCFCAEGKYIVDFAPSIKLEDIKPSLRVALRADSYQLYVFTWPVCCFASC